MTADFRSATLSLPPLYRLVRAAGDISALDEARRLALTGEHAGAFVWSPDPMTAECAVILAPEQPLETAYLSLYLAALGVGDALGALVPPGVAVTFGWPDRIDVNGAAAGAIRLATDQSNDLKAVPDWLAVGVSMQVGNDPSDGSPGRNPMRTTLHDEGCGDVGVPAFLESFSRHFLHWINRWQDEGLAPVRRAWLSRASGFGEDEDDVEIAADSGPYVGKPTDIDNDGNLVLQTAAGPLTVNLPAALQAADRARRRDVIC